MYTQQQQAAYKLVVIPSNQIQKYSHILSLPPYPYLEYRQCLQVKPKTVYGAYSSESMIKLIRSVEDNKKEFLQIIAINTTLDKNNKKQFVVDKILREHAIWSFDQLLKELRIIRQTKRDKALYKQYVQFIKVLLQKAKHLLYKHCETLVMVLGDCINFYLRVTQSQNGRHQFSLVMAFDKINISFCSSNEFCQSILHCMICRLRECCTIDGYELEEKELTWATIQGSTQNLIYENDIPSCFRDRHQERLQILQGRLTSKQSDPQIMYTTLLVKTLTKYAEDIFFLIESTIVFLSNLVLEKKQLKSITYDEQFIEMKNLIDKTKPLGETFLNLYCEHFEGLPQQLYKNGTRCPYCSQPIIVDEIKCFQRNRNIFQNLLARNYLNPNGENVIYYFRDKVFSLATKDRFLSYAHFCQFIKKHNFVRDRPEVLMILQTQKISLYNKLWGKKKLFTEQELIECPVRGKYCRHLEFYDLQRVYENYIKREEGQTAFQCFLCFEPIQYSEIIYLHQVKLLIDLAKHNFYSVKTMSTAQLPQQSQERQPVMLNSSIQINHIEESVELCCELQKGYMQRKYLLPIYSTLIDPLTKSQKKKPIKVGNENNGQNNAKNDEYEDQFQYTQQFANFYFGH